jgi:hypothetical protein
MRPFFVRRQLKLKVLDRISEKNPNIILRENQSNMNRVVPCRQTDRHDKGNSRFSQFCERSHKQYSTQHASCLNTVLTVNEYTNFNCQQNVFCFATYCSCTNNNSLKSCYFITDSKTRQCSWLDYPQFLTSKTVCGFQFARCLCGFT